MNGLLKFITCGSVDDGKSTLIGHILYDSKLLYADQEKALILDSKVGSRGGEIDYSLLLDGLMAEREQGITIDVAYRYFTTDRRSFIVADTPGHEEYTRNMAVGASFAQLAIILVDAKQGVLVQTKRHSRICSLMGISHFVFAVNKMDLVDYSEERFLEIEKDILALAEELSLKNIKIIPVSATEGDNVTKKSENITWYKGEALLSYLEQADVSETNAGTGFYMPIQRVCRPSHEFRGFQGQAESGKVTVGQKLVTLPSNETATVKSILVGDKNSEEAVAGQAVTIQLDREVDVSRGCVLSGTGRLPVGKSIRTTLLWMDDEPLQVGNEYLVKLGTKMIPAVVKNVAYKIDVNTGRHLTAGSVTKNEIISCDMVFSEKIVVDEFKRNKTLGELILIDRVSHMTSACGVVERVEDEEERPYFEKDGIRAGGYIFEEFYFNLENAFLSRQKTKETTYHAGDRVPTEGDSFKYPDYFDVISIEDSAAVLIRNREIQDIISLDAYEYSGLPILDERGFALRIGTKADFNDFLNEFKLLEKENKIAFHNKWSKFETYRRIVCNENFWMI
ncbi:sulfate adenylyltransferase subunit 1 [Clostridium sp. Marseille-P2415]|uniref:sulfate adenylyltransferase subunit 1 n=1 Tax=Clostridium sp. Marseille-P2415 TaxID=1805471 RepID=UPI0009888BED|nr:GTP-binding protein [Clostridium sp. Marseille-P2415]